MTGAGAPKGPSSNQSQEGLYYKKHPEFGMPHAWADKELLGLSVVGTLSCLKTVTALTIAEHVRHATTRWTCSRLWSIMPMHPYAQIRCLQIQHHPATLNRGKGTMPILYEVLQHWSSQIYRFSTSLTSHKRFFFYYICIQKKHVWYVKIWGHVISYSM